MNSRFTLTLAWVMFVIASLNMAVLVGAIGYGIWRWVS